MYLETKISKNEAVFCICLQQDFPFSLIFFFSLSKVMSIFISRAWMFYQLSNFKSSILPRDLTRKVPNYNNDTTQQRVVQCFGCLIFLVFKGFFVHQHNCKTEQLTILANNLTKILIVTTAEINTFNLPHEWGNLKYVTI